MRTVLLSAAQRIAVPWKNGGGVTQEVAVAPADAGIDDFGWRLSIAEVRSDGPFSEFHGVDRHLAVLAGRLALDIEHAPPRHLEPTDEPLSFPGDRPTFGRPIDGFVRDLNLMVRRDAYQGQLSRPNSAIFICIADTTIVVAVESTLLHAEGVPWKLAPLDALLAANGTSIRCEGELVVAQINARPNAGFATIVVFTRS